MAKKSYSENITSAKVMADGLNRHRDNLPAGVKESQITELEPFTPPLKPSIASKKS